MSSSQFSLLTTRRFLPLFSTQFWGAFNDNAFKASLAVLITYTLIADVNRAQLLVNLAGGVFILPFFLFSTLAGEISDKYSRTRLIRLLKFLEIIIMGLGMLGFYLGNVVLLMITLFLMGTHSTFFGPTKYSALPDLLQPKELLAGNSLVEASTFIAILIGTILGTQLGATTHGALLVSSICIIVGMLGWISSWFITRLPIGEPNLVIHKNILAATFNLIRDTRQNRQVFFAIMAISWFWFLGFIFLTQFPVYARGIINGNEQIVTLFLVVFSIGIAVGSLLCNLFLRGKVHARYAPINLLIMGVAVLDFCWASSGHIPLLAQTGGIAEFLAVFAGWRIISDLFILAVAGGFYIVPLYALMQERSDVAHRSRVIACNNIVNALFMFAAALVAMLLTEIGFSSVQMFLVLGIANLFVAFYTWKKLVKE